MITIEPPRGTDRPAESGMTRAALLRFLRLARASVGVEGEVHVLLADDATLRRLNRQFRGKNKPTDVLSFPAGSSGVFSAQKELAGDLAISLDIAARQAKHFDHTLGDEVRVLILHGLLHLAGFDHEQDEGQMAAREAELRSELGLPGGLIERASVRKAKAVGRKIRSAVTGPTSSGSFDSVSRNRVARTSAQDDGITRSARRSAQDDGVRDGSGLRKRARTSAQDDRKKRVRA
jgi:probable rRNA maturation factor